MSGPTGVMRAARRFIKRFVPEEVLESRRYWAAHGRLPNLRRPTRFTEKVVLRKLYDRNPLFPLCSDKHAVRRYVRDRIGDDTLVPVVAVTETPEDLLDLPEWRMTVMKPNHGSQMVLVNADEEPSPDQKRRHVSLFRRWLEVDFSVYRNEWQYAAIPRNSSSSATSRSAGASFSSGSFTASGSATARSPRCSR